MLIRLPKRAVAGLVLATVCSAAAGCGGAPDPATGQPAPSEASPSGMQLYVAPPRRVPTVHVGTVTARPAQYAWRIGTRFEQQNPPSDDRVVSTDVPASTAPLAAVIDGPVRPTQARFIVYPRSAGSIPSGAGTTHDCTTATGCTMTEGSGSSGGHWRVTLDEVVAPPALIVLDLQYATLEPADVADGIPSYGASWVVRVKPA